MTMVRFVASVIIGVSWIMTTVRAQLPLCNICRGIPPEVPTVLSNPSAVLAKLEMTPISCQLAQNIALQQFGFVGFTEDECLDYQALALDKCGCPVATVAPTQMPVPTPFPTPLPSQSPSISDAPSSSASPTGDPSESPSSSPSISASPSAGPSAVPSVSPTASPSESPSTAPSGQPSVTPSVTPSGIPSESPSDTPSASPSLSPSTAPSASPTAVPSSTPTECTVDLSLGVDMTLIGQVGFTPLPSQAQIDQVNAAIYDEIERQLLEIYTSPAVSFTFTEVSYDDSGIATDGEVFLQFNIDGVIVPCTSTGDDFRNVYLNLAFALVVVTVVEQVPGSFFSTVGMLTTDAVVL